MSNEMIPQYSTKIFTEIWDNVDDFIDDYSDNGIPTTIHYGEEKTETENYPQTAQTLFYLLYARYGNTPIANYDEEQWKYKVFSTIFMYGPTWEKRLDIQEKLRALSEEELYKGTRAIFNTALNPNIEPSTSSTEELDYINSQNTTNYKKSKMDAYTQLVSLLETDVTKAFIDKFDPLFKKFARPAKTWIYVTDEDEEEDDE